MQIPTIPFRWNNTTPLKWTLAFVLVSSYSTFSGVTTVKAEETSAVQSEFTTAIKQNFLPVSKQKKEPKVLIDAPHIKQKPELPRGCEVTSLAMLLGHAGHTVDKMTLAKQVNRVPFEKNGLRGNLHDGFVGDMYSFYKPGIGVYHEPIKRLAEAYHPFMVIDFSGSDFNEVIAYLNQNRPVWVVVTSTFNVVPDKYWRSWKTRSGPLKITYKMHSVLVTGYDQNYIYVNDPLTTKNRPLPRQQFIAGWEQMGKQAITLKTLF